MFLPSLTSVNFPLCRPPPQLREEQQLHFSCLSHLLIALYSPHLPPAVHPNDHTDHLYEPECVRCPRDALQPQVFEETMLDYML